MTSVPQWNVFEISLSGPTSDNPPNDVQLDAIFAKPR